MMVILMSSIGYHNRSYDYENDNIHAKTKSSEEKCEKGRSHLSNQRFSENFIYDPIDLYDL